jgi:hypothetical protein
MYVAGGGVQTTIAEPLSSVPAWLRVNVDPGCPAAALPSACGFRSGERLVVFDDAGGFDLLTATDVAGETVAVDQTAPLTHVYRAGARLSSITVRTLAWSRTTQQLIERNAFDGRRVPIVDRVSGLRFDYFGDRTPPTLRTRGALVLPSYGPSPPPVDVQGDAQWPPGTNCTFTVMDDGVSVRQVARLPELAGTGGLVKLQEDGRSDTWLTDGPWCPDALSANRWDADLLRIRRIRITIRVEPPTLAFAGRWPRSSIEIATDVTPPNLGLRR